MTVGAVILARTSSRRLPGKVLRLLAGKPLVDHVIDRTCRIPSVSRPVVATSDDPSDDSLAAHCCARGVSVYRGALDNAAMRVRDCARAHGWDYFARVNADSPFLDPTLIERGLRRALDERLDFVTNLQPRTYPYGIAVEVFSRDAFERAYDRMSLPDDYEHVGAYFHRRLTEFRYANLACAERHPTDVRLTIDTEADLIRAEDAITQLGSGQEGASWQQVAAAYRAGHERAAAGPAPACCPC